MQKKQRKRRKINQNINTRYIIMVFVNKNNLSKSCLGFDQISGVLSLLTNTKVVQFIQDVIFLNI
jgi:hypothetical protein